MLPWRLVNFYENPLRIDASRAEHFEIMELIVSGKVEESRELMRRHVASLHAITADLLARRTR